MSKQLKLNGNTLEYLDHYISSTTCVLRFFNANYDELISFFGSGIFANLILVDNETMTEKTLKSRYKVASIQTEAGTHVVKKRNVIREGYFSTEPVLDEDGTEVETSDGTPVVHDVFYPAEVETTEETISGLIFTVILETPNIYDEVAQLNKEKAELTNILADYETLTNILVQKLSDDEALTVSDLFDTWDNLVKTEYVSKKLGYKFRYDGDLYKTLIADFAFKQDVTPHSNPSVFKKVGE